MSGTIMSVYGRQVMHFPTLHVGTCCSIWGMHATSMSYTRQGSKRVNENAMHVCMCSNANATHVMGQATRQTRI